MKTVHCLNVIGAIAILALGCATAPQTPIARSMTTAEKTVSDTLQLVADAEYDQALEMLSLAYTNRVATKDEQSHLALHMAHAVFLKGEYKKAIEGYKFYLNSYPDAPEWERLRVEYEVTRLQDAVDFGVVPEGDSLAVNHLRGDMALVKAEKLLAQGLYNQAHVQLDRAFQYLGDPSLLLESGLAASMAGRWSQAKFQLTAYLAYNGHLLDDAQLDRLQTEIEEVERLDRGLNIDKRMSFAECVYEVRGLPRLSIHRSADTNFDESLPVSSCPSR